jgi:hypothetical protein
VTAEIHFVQGGEAPILIGAGTGTLACTCGNTLATGYDPDRVLGIGIQCARCGTVTATAPLPEGIMPTASAIIAEPSPEPRTTSMTVPRGVSVIGRTEMDRLQALFRPLTPADNVYQMSPERVDAAAAAYERHVGAALPAIAPEQPFQGLQEHALGWAVGHLRAQMRDPSWNGIQDNATATAALHLSGFLHFVATWSHHPLFPAMAATAADHGCSLHGLAPFAAAHCLTMMGNRIIFPPPEGYPGRIESFGLFTGPTSGVTVHTDVFDRFEFPFGEPWDHPSLLGAVKAAIERAQGKINVRNPGLLLLSPGSALGGFDGALNKALESAMFSLGRKNRGLMAVAAIVLRQQPTPDPAAVRFGYGFVPANNRRFQGPAGG